MNRPNDRREGRDDDLNQDGRGSSTTGGSTATTTSSGAHEEFGPGPDPAVETQGGSTRVIVAISGGGRTLRNLLQLSEKASYVVSGVLASRSCPGLNVAEEWGLPILVENFTAANQQSHKAYQWVEALKAQWIVLAGFLKPFPVNPHWKNRIINIHPSLLPRHSGKGMYGRKVHQAVVSHGDLESGASVHFVNEVYDEGRTISQARIKVMPQDTPETLADRVFAAECELYPRTLDGLIAGNLPLPGKEIWRIS